MLIVPPIGMVTAPTELAVNENCVTKLVLVERIEQVT